MSTPPTTTTNNSEPNNQQRSTTIGPLQSHFTTLAQAQGPVITHLTDTNSIPILSSHPDPSCAGLSCLSSAFVQAHDTASRMGLGRPMRVTLTTTGGVAVVQSGIAAVRMPFAGAVQEDGGGGVGVGEEEEDEEGGYASVSVAGEMLVGTVIAPGDRLAEARMASWGVEEVARRFQKSAAGEGT